MKLIFATSNNDKLREAREILNVQVEGTDLDIDEIQSLDPVEVATKRARAYFEKLNKPIFVEDVSLLFSYFKNLPGTYINDFWKSLGNNGLIALLDGKNDRSAVAQTTVLYIDKAGKEQLFIGKIEGSISKKPLGDNGFGWDSIFIPK